MIFTESTRSELRRFSKSADPILKMRIRVMLACDEGKCVRLSPDEVYALASDEMFTLSVTLEMQRQEEDQQ